MKKILQSAVVVAVLLACVQASAQGVSRPVHRSEEDLFAWSRNIALANGTDLGGTVLAAEPFTFTAVTMKVSVGSGGGAGTTVVTVTDGAGTSCTATFACATTQTPGTYRADVANGTGNGCAFAARAIASASVSTAGCTSTQPTAIVVGFFGQRF